jgi:geranylgeranylglycerol-phosphate geranylgeranyltransferase
MKGNLKPYLEIMRPVNCVMGGFTVVIGLLISHPEETFALFLQDPLNLFLTLGGFLIFFFVAGGTNAINDYYDYPIDQINRPERPLPRGAVTQKRALQFYMFLNACALILAAIIGFLTVNGLWIPTIVLFFEGVGFFYSWKWKAMGLPGNIVVGFASAIGLPFAALFINPLQDVPPLVWHLFFTVAIFLIAREFVKGMQDVEGDSQFNIKTIANTRGLRTAGIFMLVFSVGAAVWFTVLFFVFPLRWGFLLFIIGVDLLVIAANVLLFSDFADAKKQKKASFFLKLGQLGAILAIIFGSV